MSIHSIQQAGSHKATGVLSDPHASVLNDNGALGLIMELSGKLQTTLELEGLIELFAQVIEAQFDFDSLTYFDPEEELTLKFGRRTGRNKLNYQLKVLESDLGKIQLTRTRKFKQAEIEQLENLLSALLYPLRNALLYRTALHSAFIDSLTGVKNRTAFDSNFSRDIEYSHRKQSELSLIVLDIDLFKRINDNFGHIVGDDVLRQVAQTVEHTIRSSDALYRYGGEEFAIVLNGTDQSGARLLAERIRRNMEQLEFDSLKGITVTISLGIAVMDENESADQLFARADAALYQAKEQGRNRVVTAS
ncbi:MAG: GGDEF domain-containing protein [Candidatus Thiodiazotropha sp.]